MLNTIINFILGLVGYQRIILKQALNQRDFLSKTIETINGNHTVLEQPLDVVKLKDEYSSRLNYLKESIQRKNDARSLFTGKSNNTLIYERSEIKRELDRIKTLPCSDTNCGLKNEIIDRLQNNIRIINNKLEEYNTHSYIIVKKCDSIGL